MNTYIEFDGVDSVSAATLRTSGDLVIQVFCAGSFDEVVFRAAKDTTGDELAKQMRNSLSARLGAKLGASEIADILYTALLCEDDSTPGRSEMMMLTHAITDIMAGRMDPAKAFGLLGRAGNATEPR